MLETLSRGFLGFRGDLLSDLLIVALFLIVPALLVAVWAARTHRRDLHRTTMWTVLAVLAGYVVLYEASLLAQGGMGFLRSKIRMPAPTYFFVVAVHVVLAVSGMATAVLAVRKGRRVFRAAADSAGVGPRTEHRRVGYAAFALLVVSALTGVAVYYLTFVHVGDAWVPDGAQAAAAFSPAMASPR